MNMPVFGVLFHCILFLCVALRCVASLQLDQYADERHVTWLSFAIRYAALTQVLRLISFNSPVISVYVRVLFPIYCIAHILPLRHLFRIVKLFQPSPVHLDTNRIDRDHFSTISPSLSLCPDWLVVAIDWILLAVVPNYFIVSFCVYRSLPYILPFIFVRTVGWMFFIRRRSPV